MESITSEVPDESTAPVPQAAPVDDGPQTEIFTPERIAELGIKAESPDPRAIEQAQERAAELQASKAAFIDPRPQSTYVDDGPQTEIFTPERLAELGKARPPDHLAVADTATSEASNPTSAKGGEALASQSALPSAGVTGDAAHSRANQAQDQAEQGAAISPERLEELVQNHIYGIGMEAGQGYIAAVNRSKPSGRNVTNSRLLSRLSSLEPNIAPELVLKLRHEEEKRFNDLGVAEVVTLIPAEDMFGEPSAAGYSVLQYKTLVMNKNKYPYDPQTPPSRRVEDPGKVRGGQFFGYNITGSTKDMQELFQALQQDPESARRLADMMVASPDLIDFDDRDNPMRQGKGAIEAGLWREQVRPPYEKWKQINGGVNRIAFRDSPARPPEACEVVEF